jgi:membrane protein YdbS with pleckstrin-like domain
VVSAFTGLVIGFIGGAAVYTWLSMPLLAAAAVFIPPLVLVVYSFKRYGNWYFRVEDEFLEINHGVFRKVSAVIPYVRVQHVDTNRGPLERIMGLASVRVYTAGSKGADMHIPGISKERAEKMQRELKNKAIESEQGFDAV